MLGVLRCDWAEVASLVGVAVTPVVGFLGNLSREQIHPNPDEVRRCFLHVCLRSCASVLTPRVCADPLDVMRNETSGVHFQRVVQECCSSWSSPFFLSERVRARFRRNLQGVEEYLRLPGPPIEGAAWLADVLDFRAWPSRQVHDRRREYFRDRLEPSPSVDGVVVGGWRSPATRRYAYCGRVSAAGPFRQTCPQIDPFILRVANQRYGARDAVPRLRVGAVYSLPSWSPFNAFFEGNAPQTETANHFLLLLLPVLPPPLPLLPPPAIARHWYSPPPPSPQVSHCFTIPIRYLLQKDM